MAVVSLWYRLFDRRAVWASKEWLTRVDGTPPGFWRVYRHIRTFSQVTLDKVFLIKGKTKGFEFRRTGDHLLAEQVATGRGAVLLGAHLGSYEAMRAGGTADDVPIKILGYFENAKTINALLEKLNPEHAAKVIHLGSDPVGVMAKVKDRLEDGELVALLGDRVGLNERTVTVPFFGSDARFPAGPFLLASLLRCPVYLVFGLYHPPNRYDLYCEPFADKIELPRKDVRQRSRPASIATPAGSSTTAARRPTTGSTSSTFGAQSEGRRPQDCTVSQPKRPDHAVTISHRVGFQECDPLGVVWHGRYLEWLEAARNALFGSIDLDIPQIRALGHRMYVVEAKCRYMAPLTYGDVAQITFVVWQERGAHQSQLRRAPRAEQPLVRPAPRRRWRSPTTMATCSARSPMRSASGCLGDLEESVPQNPPNGAARFARERCSEASPSGRARLHFRAPVLNKLHRRRRDAFYDADSSSRPEGGPGFAAGSR